MPQGFTVRLDDKTLEALDRLAERTDRSRSALATRAIEDYVALNQWQIGKIEEGLKAADDHDFASPQEVKRLRAKFARRR
jgi:predicted transcriptional regulator